MFQDRDEARHPATAVRMREAWSSGQFPLSRELASGLIWLGSLAILSMAGAGLWQSLMESAARSWSEPVAFSSGGETVLLCEAARTNSFFWKSLFPVLIAVASVAVLALGVQTRFGVFPRLLRRDGSSLRARGYFRRVVSLTSWSGATLGLAKLLLLCVIAWWILLGDFVSCEVPRLSGLPMIRGFSESGLYLTGVLVKLSGAACLVGLADYAVCWWSHLRRLKMSDEEVREERRATEPPAAVQHRRNTRAPRHHA